MPSANPYDRGADRLRKDEEAEGNRAGSGSPGDTVTHRTLSSDSGMFRSPFGEDEDPTPQRADLSVLGPTVHFKGELSADEDLMIQGRVEGSIHHSASHLTVGAKGKVKADVHANHIVVQGEVVGDLFANEAVIIEASARVRGNVYAPRVALHEGARFKGSIDMDGVPAEATRSTTSESKSSTSESKSTTSESKSSTSESKSGQQTRSGRKKSSSSSGKDTTVPDSEVDELLD